MFCNIVVTSFKVGSSTAGVSGCEAVDAAVVALSAALVNRVCLIKLFSVLLDRGSGLSSTSPHRCNNDNNNNEEL